jgi:ClpP class serine protease
LPPPRFGTASVVRGLKEAAEDDTIGAVVLRIDSGGGGVVESDTIHDAVLALRDKGKVVVASFGNAAASGGYLVSTRPFALDIFILF